MLRTGLATRMTASWFMVLSLTSGGCRSLVLRHSEDASISPEVAEADVPEWMCDVGWYSPDVQFWGIEESEAMARYSMEMCGLGEARRLLEESRCPPSDPSVLSEGERLLLGGDPANKTTMPRGAQCPSGFERLPRIVVPTEGCAFTPTCWGANVVTRIPEPAVMDGKYVLSGLDALLLADPYLYSHGVHWVLNPEDYINGNGVDHFRVFMSMPQRCSRTDDDGRCTGCLEFEDPWPFWSLQAMVPLTRLDEEHVELCAARNGPVVDISERETLAHYGSFYVRVLVPYEVLGQTLTVQLLTYCCGPVLMLWPEDAKLAVQTAKKRCQDLMDEALRNLSNPEYELANPDLLVNVCRQRLKGENCPSAASAFGVGTPDLFDSVEYGLPPVFQNRMERGWEYNMAPCWQKEVCPPCVALTCAVHREPDGECTNDMQKTGGQTPGLDGPEMLWLMGATIHGNDGPIFYLEVDQDGNPRTIRGPDPEGHLTIEVPYRSPDEMAAEIAKYAK